MVLSKLNDIKDIAEGKLINNGIFCFNLNSIARMISWIFFVLFYITNIYYGTTGVFKMF